MKCHMEFTEFFTENMVHNIDIIMSQIFITQSVYRCLVKEFSA